MALHIQNPAGLSGKLLHDSILTEANKASSGGGAFAFATKGGVELLLESHQFREILRNGSFTLIVGLDGITDTKAIACLKSYSEKYNTLTVKAFYHEESGAIFHPKFSWFQNTKEPEEGSLITGSGNLTPRGLRNNWEAYYVTPLMKEQFRKTKATWDTWLSLHQQFLLDLDDPKVLDKAKQNEKLSRKAFSEKVKQKTKARKVVAQKPQIVFGEQTVTNNQYLLLEVPVGRSRGTPSAYTQANLGKAVFEQFFGIDINANTGTFYFQHVDENGLTENMENTKPIIKKVSSNYNFKLEATDGKGSPEPKSPPLCIFTELGPNTYRYRFLLPNDDSYNELRKYLLSQPSIATGGHKYIGDQDELFSVIPSAEFLPSLLANDI
ncbi:phospholipase D family protein [Pseudoalteromonas agarivorans]|uniref:phospholipase D family protein n=1 Tax=Pseudoalteromonas agarivorans TaxID=176102 RepID=UPI00312001A5